MPAWVGVVEGTHDSVPGFSIRITADKHKAVYQGSVGVVMIPKGDVFTKVDIVG